MPRFSARSLARLDTCHADLRRLFLEVVKHFDCTVLEGHRGQEAQDEAFAAGRSKLRWPNGRHNTQPSLAVDVAPWPLDWSDTGRFRYFGGYVLGIAQQLDIPVRWGGDWDGDTQVRDQRFNDLVHFELRRARPEGD